MSNTKSGFKLKIYFHRNPYTLQALWNLKICAFEDYVLLRCDAVSHRWFPMFSSFETPRTTHQMTQHNLKPHMACFCISATAQSPFLRRQLFPNWQLLKFLVKITHPNPKSWTKVCEHKQTENKKIQVCGDVIGL
jgi:hypothetical protein